MFPNSCHPVDDQCRVFNDLYSRLEASTWRAPLQFQPLHHGLPTLQRFVFTVFTTRTTRSGIMASFLATLILTNQTSGSFEQMSPRIRSISGDVLPPLFILRPFVVLSSVTGTSASVMACPIVQLASCLFPPTWPVSKFQMRFGTMSEIHLPP